MLPGMEASKKGGPFNKLAQVCSILLILHSIVSVSARRACCERPDSASSDLEIEQFKNCTCLYDNTQLADHFIPAETYGLFHWRLSDFSLLGSEGNRSTIQFRMSPCNGRGEMLINPLLTPWPTLEDSRWNASYIGEESRLDVEATYADYYVSIYAHTDFTFSLSVITQMSVSTDPGGFGILDAEQTGENELSVRWNTSSTLGAKYQLYFVERPQEPTHPCSETQSPNPECIMRTGCGLRFSGVPVVNRFETLPPDTEAFRLVTGLQKDVEYFFNVALLSPSGIVTAYRGTIGKLNYQRVTQLTSNDTTIIMSSSIGGVAALALFAVFMFKRSLDKKVQRERKERKQKKEKKSH